MAPSSSICGAGSTSRSSKNPSTSTPSAPPSSNQTPSMVQSAKPSPASSRFSMDSNTHSQSQLYSRTHSRSTSSQSSSSGFDRELFQKLNDVTTEMDRISRMSMDLPENRELEQVQADLKRAQQSSSIMIQSQKDILDKIERQERSTFRRYFMPNREQKTESLKAKLWERMSESALVDEELERLERQSGVLLESRRTTFVALDDGNQVDALELSYKLEELEREKQDIVSNLVSTVAIPDAQQLNTRIAMYVSEIRACESIQKQVEKCSVMYRQALQQLRTALSTILSSTYTGTLKEFVTGPYVLAVEAGHLIEAASHVVQPEANRRYRDFAPEVKTARPPKFPQAVTDFAKRARVNYDRKSSLSVEGTRKLRTAENVIVLMHRIVIQKLEIINKWKSAIERDLNRASDVHRRLDGQLHEQMSVLARSVSV